MARELVFYIGLVFMLLSLLWPVFPVPASERWNRVWLFDLGLLLAIASHGWPGGL